MPKVGSWLAGFPSCIPLEARSAIPRGGDLTEEEVERT